MGLLSIILLVIFAIAALIMILVIMLQDDQGEGIGGLFGGGSTTPFGSRSGNILTRFTSILGAIFVVGAFALAWLNRSPETTDIVEKARLERIQEAEQSNWWVERIEEVEPGTGEETGEDGESEAPLGINR
jgi:preprotein translocase subunit SecG